MTESGYDGLFAAHKLHGFIEDICRDAHVGPARSVYIPPPDIPGMQPLMAGITLARQAIVQYLRRLRNLSEDHIRGEITENGEQYTLALRREGGTRALVTVTADNPDDVLFHGALKLLEQAEPFVAGAWHWECGEYDDAIAMARQCLKDESWEEKGLAYNLWGNALADLARNFSGDPVAQQLQYAEVCDKYRQATELDDTLAVAFYNWGNDLRQWAEFLADFPEKQQAKYAEACEKYERATDIDAYYATAWSNWGNVLYTWARVMSDDPADQAEHYAAACKKFILATDLHDKDALAFYNWGNALHHLAKILSDKPAEQQRKYAEACEKYARATTLAEMLSDAWYNWGFALMARSRGEESLATKMEHAGQAVAKFEIFLKLEPDAAEADEVRDIMNNLHRALQPHVNGSERVRTVFEKLDALLSDLESDNPNPTD